MNVSHFIASVVKICQSLQTALIPTGGFVPGTTGDFRPPDPWAIALQINFYISLLCYVILETSIRQSIIKIAVQELRF